MPFQRRYTRVSHGAGIMAFRHSLLRVLGALRGAGLTRHDTGGAPLVSTAHITAP